MQLQSPFSTQGKSDGLTWGQSAVASGTLVASLAVMHFLLGTPTGMRDWLLLAATAVVAPAVGYLLAVRRFDTSFGVAVMVLTVTFVIAGL